jgi:hypothetical protein
MVDRAGIAGEAAVRFWHIFDLLTRESLDFAPRVAASRFSGICRDGTPWQFYGVLGGGSAPVRFLTEIGSPASPLSARTALTVSRIAAICEVIGAPKGPRIANVLATLSPPDDDHLASLWVGLAAGGAIGPRLRVYANAGWGGATGRWLRLITALRELDAGGFGARLEPLLPRLVPEFNLAGFAVTIPATPLLCKLYLRPAGSGWNAARAVANALLGARSETFVAAIEETLGPLEELPPRALVLSIAGSAAGGALDLKLDFCGHCLFDSEARAGHAVERLAHSFGLDLAPYHAMLADLGPPSAGAQRVAFVGIGREPDGADRINIYFAPFAMAEGAARPT